MAEHNDLGTQGENLAKAYLEEKNYIILETNWRSGRAEVDIIAKDGDCLVIVEVKTRSKDTVRKPQEAVGRKKQKLLVRAAGVYAEKIGHDWEVRFDVIAITKYKNPPKIEHIVDAFYPNWTW
ncbi:MAG: YraN family protein [Saprospiraceae bacterium]